MLFLQQVVRRHVVIPVATSVAAAVGRRSAAAGRWLLLLLWGIRGVRGVAQDLVTVGVQVAEGRDVPDGGRFGVRRWSHHYFPFEKRKDVFFLANGHCSSCW